MTNHPHLPPCALPSSCFFSSSAFLPLIVLQFFWGGRTRGHSGSWLPERHRTPHPHPSTGRWSLNPWTTRQVPPQLAYLSPLLSILPLAVSPVLSQGPACQRCPIHPHMGLLPSPTQAEGPVSRARVGIKPGPGVGNAPLTTWPKSSSGVSPKKGTQPTRNS